MKWHIVTEWEYSLVYDLTPREHLENLRNNELEDYLANLNKKIQYKFANDRTQPNWGDSCDYSIKYDVHKNNIYFTLRFTHFRVSLALF